MKKAMALTLALAMCLTALALPANAADTVTAQPTASIVYINGTAVAFEAYTIAGSNYFKLRDLAYALGGTPKQFAVGYDESTKAVTLTSGGAYTAVGSEMAKGDGKPKSAMPTASRIYLDGRELSLTVYNIGGSNFFKLRDLMEVLNVYVGYDEPTKAITLDTGRGYGQTGGTDKPTDSPSGNSSLVGLWITPENTNILDWTYDDNWARQGGFTAVVGYGLYEFKSNGEFLWRYKMRTWNAVSYTFLQWQGNYRVEGDKIIFSNVVENFINFNRSVDNYENKTLSGEFVYYHRANGTSGDGRSIINIENTASGFSDVSTNWYKVESTTDRQKAVACQDG